MLSYRRAVRALPRIGVFALLLIAAAAALWATLLTTSRGRFSLYYGSYLGAAGAAATPWYLHAYSVPEETLIYPDVYIASILDQRQLDSVRRRMPADGPAARNAVVLLKTHKTGSSTLQNILFRYGLLRDLSFALPHGDRASFFWPIEFRHQFVARQRVREFNILCHHLVYDGSTDAGGGGTELALVVPARATRVTIVRHPVDVFRSAYDYFNLERLCYGQPLERFYESASLQALRAQKCIALRMPARNFMAVDLGLPIAQMDNETAVRELIERVDREFDLVLVNEQFDLSLAVLRRTLGWSLDDVVALPQNVRGGGGGGGGSGGRSDGGSGDGGNVRHSRRRALSDDDDDRRLAAEILAYNRADALIYEHFAERFVSDVLARFDRAELERDAAELRNLTALWRDRCVERTAPAAQLADRALRPYGRGTNGYVLRPHMSTDVMCRLLALPELPLTRWLKHRAIANNRDGELPYFPPF